MDDARGPAGVFAVRTVPENGSVLADGRADADDRRLSLRLDYRAAGESPGLAGGVLVTDPRLVDSESPLARTPVGSPDSPADGITPAVARQSILWTIPVFDSVKPQPFGAFLGQCLGAWREGTRYDIVPHVPARQLLHGAMNAAVDLAISHDFTYLLMSDDDCFPPFDAIPRLLRHMEAGADIVCGLGIMRGYPHTTTVGRYFPEGFSLVVDPKTGAHHVAGFEWLDALDELTNGPELVPVDFCGFPIAIVRVDALKKIQAPWFGTEVNGGSCTHDVYFGHKAKLAGLQVYVDRTLKCHHLADAPVMTFENRQVARQLQSAWKQAREGATA